MFNWDCHTAPRLDCARMPQFVWGVLLCLAAPSTSFAQLVTAREALLVDEGFRVFTEEKFEGNGRTCATCHIPEANYSISPDDIAQLNDEDRALVFARNVPGLEDPALLNDLALFNVKGGERAFRELSAPKNTFRGSMTIAALDLTSRVINVPVPAPLGPQLGWAGDASPDTHRNHGNLDLAADGSIRAFANGAIAQHSTKSLARVAGRDFRFATHSELDALEAFQRWLGRRPTPSGAHEFNLALLRFEDARVEQGKAVFLSPQATCNVCHTNGGSNLAGAANLNLDTGVESERRRLRYETGVALPADEGALNTLPDPANPLARGAFNVQSIIEAPRKKIYFHNGAVVGDIEDAAKFYFSESFLRSPSNLVLPLPAAITLGHCTSVACLNRVAPFGLEKLGAFMRSLSAFYSLVDADRLIQESIERARLGLAVKVPLLHGAFALRDVRYVLSGSHVLPRPYEPVGSRAGALSKALEEASSSEGPVNTPELLLALSTVRKLRDAIAHTPELP